MEQEDIPQEEINNYITKWDRDYLVRAIPFICQRLGWECSVAPVGKGLSCAVTPPSGYSYCMGIQPDNDGSGLDYWDLHTDYDYQARISTDTTEVINSVIRLVCYFEIRAVTGG